VIAMRRRNAQGFGMKLKTLRLVCLVAAAVIGTAQVFAEEPNADDQKTIAIFKNAGESGHFFDKAYGFAVFPSIGKGGMGIGAAHGKGRVYEKGKPIGQSTMNQLSVGAQLGGQAYREIIFFQDERALRDFTKGNFELGADASAVAINAGAGAKAGTGGS